MKYSLHIIYALKFGGGEKLLDSLVLAGDNVISLTNNSTLENIQTFKLPFRLKSKNNYYNFIDYFRSIPTLFYLIIYLYLKKRNSRLVFHGFPFQFIVPILSSLNLFNDIHLVYHQYKRSPNLFFGKISCKIEEIFLKLSCNFKLIAVSPWVLDRLIINFNIKSRKNLFIFNLPVLNKDSEVKPPSIKLPEKFILYGARLVKAKGHIRFLEFLNCSRIKKEIKYEIIFCGSGPELNNILKYVQINLPNLNIKIISTLSHSEYLYLVKKASACVIPSFRESFSISTLEAAYYSPFVFAFEKYLCNHFNGQVLSMEKIIPFIQGDLLDLNPIMLKQKEELYSLYRDNRVYYECIFPY